MREEVTGPVRPWPGHVRDRDRGVELLTALQRGERVVDVLAVGVGVHVGVLDFHAVPGQVRGPDHGHERGLTDLGERPGLLVGDAPGAACRALGEDQVVTLGGVGPEHGGEPGRGRPRPRVAVEDDLEVDAAPLGGEQGVGDPAHREGVADDPDRAVPGRVVDVVQQPRQDLVRRGGGVSEDGSRDRCERVGGSGRGLEPRQRGRGQGQRGERGGQRPQRRERHQAEVSIRE